MAESNDMQDKNIDRRLPITAMKFWHNDLEAVAVIVIILLILGSINVYSATFVLAEHDNGTPYFFIKKHLIIMAVSLVFGALIARVDYHKWSVVMPIVTIGLIIALAAIFVVGTEVNGARRWIGVGGVSVQPAEFAKLCCIIIMANYLNYRIRLGKKPTLFDARNILIFCTIAGLIYKEPDMGTATIVIGIPLILMVVVGLPTWELAFMAVSGPLAAIMMVLTNEYRWQRVQVWLDPFADALNTGFQTVRSLIAIGSGGWWGMGLGNGISKNFYLPEAHTDFAFAIFSQENGFILVVMVVLLYAILSVYMLRIANNAKDIYGHLLAVGIMLLIVGQAVANMLMVSGILPVIGVPLPFISYGGSSLMVTIMALGILTNIALQSDNEEREKIRQLRRKEIAARPKRRPLLKVVKH